MRPVESSNKAHSRFDAGATKKRVKQMQTVKQSAKRDRFLNSDEIRARAAAESGNLIVRYDAGNWALWFAQGGSIVHQSGKETFAFTDLATSVIRFRSIMNVPGDSWTFGDGLDLWLTKIAVRLEA